jgi:hypothetical protein
MHANALHLGKTEPPGEPFQVNGQAQYEQTKAWLESQGFTAVAQDFADTTSWIYGNVLFVRK